MEENFNQQKPTSGSTKEVIIRTMESDIKALEQSGGEAVIPQPIKTEEAKPVIEIPGYLGPEKPIFASRSEVAAEKINGLRQPTLSSRTLKIVGVVILILLIIAAFGLLGYFAVTYLVSTRQMPSVQ